MLLKRILVGSWRFNNLSGWKLQSWVKTVLNGARSPVGWTLMILDVKLFKVYLQGLVRWWQTVFTVSSWLWTWLLLRLTRSVTDNSSCKNYMYLKPDNYTRWTSDSNTDNSTLKYQNGTLQTANNTPISLEGKQLFAYLNHANLTIGHGNQPDNQINRKSISIGIYMLHLQCKSKYTVNSIVIACVARASQTDTS